LWTPADKRRETLRTRYAAKALATTEPAAGAGRCSGGDRAIMSQLFGAGPHADQRDELPDTALPNQSPSTSGPAAASTY
jgi:hypothetical protein